MGTHDGTGNEFGLAPGNYRRYSVDPTYVVGTSEPKDWSYVLPGPGDPWGGNRPHRQTIYFQLSEKPQADCDFVCDFVETHNSIPPKLTLWLNGAQVAAWQAPVGNGDDAIYGKPETGKHTTWTAHVPFKFTKAGLNQLEIRSEDGSWVVYDDIRFMGPSKVRTLPVPPQLTLGQASQDQVVLKTSNGPQQRVTLDITNLGPAGDLKVSGGVNWSGHVGTGRQNIQVPVPAVKRNTSLELTLEMGSFRVKHAVAIKPIRPWKVYLLPHSHVDIGYTDLQPTVAKMHRRNFFDAIQVASASAGMNPDDRYHFTCEATWTLDDLLRDGTLSEREAVKKAIQSGMMDCSGNYCNTLTGLMRPEEMIRGYGYSDSLKKWLGTPLETATQTDVPGVTWGAVQAMNQAGIQNLVLMPNPSDRIGGVLREWKDKPFFWVSPSGKERILVWETASYGVAHGLRHFNGDRTKIFRTADPTQNFIDGYIPNRLKTLAEEGYPYDMLAFPWSGTDNFPIDADVAAAAKHWNETYETPHVIVSTASQACAALRERYAKQIPEVRGDLTPYWEDGAGSSALETAMNRATGDRLVQAEALSAMTGAKNYNPKIYWEAWRNAILYSEHTWGAYNSISEPDAEFVRGQWAIKRGFAVEAERISKQLLFEFLSSTPEFSVANTSCWTRTDLVTLIADQSRAGDRVVDATGKAVPSQRLSSGELAFLAKDVPPFSQRGYRVVRGKPFVEGTVSAGKWSLKSPEWTIALDPKTGGVTKLWSTAQKRDFAGSTKGHRVNQYLYVPGDDLKKLTSAHDIHWSVIDAGPLVARVRVSSQGAGTKGLTQDIRLVAGLDRVDFDNVLDKTAVREKEGVHFAFPFSVPQGQVRIHGPWSIIRPDVDQMPGSNKNWFMTQYFADVSNGQTGITWTSLDAPLMEVGSISATILDGGFNPDQWIKKIGPTQTLYSWALNNHWYTNYRADQEGRLEFRYRVGAHGAYSATAAYQFGAGAAQPLVVVNHKPQESLFTVDGAGVVVSDLKPSNDGRAWIVRLWCPGDKPATAQLKWRPRLIKRSYWSNAGEEQLRPCPERITLQPQQVITLRCELSR